MSTPANPLDKYRSYAYHHILLVSSNTEAFRELTNPSLTTTQEQEILDNLKLGEPLHTSGNPNATYFLICDTRKVSYFSITDVSYTSTITAGNSTYSNIIYGDIDMEIVDPMGVTFVNYLQYITDTKLNVSLHKAVFLLKTIFIGHTHDGQTETIFQNAIPMMMFSMNMSPSSAGSVCDIKFCPLISGGIDFIGDYSIAQNIARVYAKNNTLKEAIQDLEYQLNSKSRKWYQDIQLKIVNQGGTTSEKPNEGYGKLVQYMITIPDDWYDFKIKGVFDQSKEVEFSSNGKKGTTEVKGVFIGLTTTPDSTMLSLIEAILRQSDDVQKLPSNDNRSAGNLRNFKILTGITSDDDTVVVHFDIVNYAIPKKETREDPSFKTDSVGKQTLAHSRSAGNEMVFDYIFTGKNTDILDFDMKLNNINLLIADDLAIGDKSMQEVEKNQEGKEEDQATTKKKEIVLKLKENDPVMPPAKTGSEQSNYAWSVETDERTKTIKARQQAIHNISLSHGLSSFNVIMRIRGNPNLYNRYSNADLFPHVRIIDNVKLSNVLTENFVTGGTSKTFLNSSDIALYKKELAEKIRRDNREDAFSDQGQVTMLPFYIKVNIRGQDYSVTDIDPDAFSAFKPFVDMWYKGWYIVFKIDHKFNKGVFTQELLLGSVPFDLYGQENTSNTAVDNGTSGIVKGDS